MIGRLLEVWILPLRIVAAANFEPVSNVIILLRDSLHSSQLYVENKRLDSIAPTLSFIRRNGREDWVTKWITTWFDAVDEALETRGMMRFDRELIRGF